MKMKMKTGIQIHPAARVFPMLPDDELQELAADIKRNGLREPLKINKEGLLVDGRNRLEACRMAGVEPRIEELNGNVDPVAYILSANINRRHLTKGQRAMAVAMIHPEAEKGGRGKKSILNIEFFSRQYLDHARAVLSVLPELAKQVLDGTISLNEAYDQARKEHNLTEHKKDSLESLLKTAPDLAALVDEERMKLAEALAAYEKRVEQKQSEIRVAIGNLERVLNYLGPASDSDRSTPEKVVAGYIKYPEVLAHFDPKHLRFAVKAMTVIAESQSI